jgi:hypothetical protein
MCNVRSLSTFNVFDISSCIYVQGYTEENAMRGQVHELENLLKSRHKTSLDDSQIEAIKLALSNRLALMGHMHVHWNRGFRFNFVLRTPPYWSIHVVALQTTSNQSL